MQTLQQEGHIDLFYGDESGFSPLPVVPYGWQPPGQVVVRVFLTGLQPASERDRDALAQQVIKNAPRSLILIDDLDFEQGQPITDDDPVYFRNKSAEHRMTLKQTHEYARRYGIRMLIVLPAKREA